MTKKETKNARPLYRQQVLSGYERFVQPENQDDSSSQDEQGREETPKGFWQQKSYLLSIPIIIEKTGFRGDEYQYKILINDDADIPVSSYSARSKKATSSPVTIHSETSSKTNKIPMVYGIHEGEVNPFSHPDGRGVPELIASIYSYVLGQIDRTLQRAVQFPAQQEGNDDARQRNKGTQSHKSLGANMDGRRGKKVRAEVRAEATSESSSKVDENDREILGNRPGDREDKLVGVDNDTFEGTGLEGIPLEF
jgi:hypothetical protein